MDNFWEVNWQGCLGKVDHLVGPLRLVIGCFGPAGATGAVLRQEPVGARLPAIDVAALASLGAVILEVCRCGSSIGAVPEEGRFCRHTAVGLYLRTGNLVFFLPVRTLFPLGHLVSSSAQTSDTSLNTLPTTLIKTYSAAPLCPHLHPKVRWSRSCPIFIPSQQTSLEPAVNKRKSCASRNKSPHHAEKLSLQSRPPATRRRVLVTMPLHTVSVSPIELEACFQPSSPGCLDAKTMGYVVALPGPGPE